MTKSELVEKLSLKLRGLTKTEIEVIVDTLFDKLTLALKKGGRVEIRGFGTFEVRKRHARQGRNPKTGASVYVKNRHVPFFKVGKELRERVNHSKNEKTSPDVVKKNQTQITSVV